MISLKFFVSFLARDFIHITYTYFTRKSALWMNFLSNQIEGLQMIIFLLYKI